jgi:hypothetical protein
MTTNLESGHRLGSLPLSRMDPKMNLAKKEGSHESTDAQSPWSDALLRDAGFGPSVAADRSGGGTDAGVFEAVAHVLAHDYTVVTYDPRGNSRSPLDGPPTDQQIAVHSDDARRLLSTTASDPAAVFGSSSGRDKVTKLSPPRLFATSEAGVFPLLHFLKHDGCATD